MSLYRVELVRTDSYSVEVEADDPDQALEMAYEDAPSLCAHCSGMGSGTKGSVDEGEWMVPEDFFRHSEYDPGLHGVGVQELA